MEISEQLRKVDKPVKREKFDVRSEAKKMVQRHERYLKKLRETTDSSESFNEAALQATEQFKQDLQAFLKEQGSEELYEEMVGFVSGTVQEIVRQSQDTSSQT